MHATWSPLRNTPAAASWPSVASQSTTIVPPWMSSDSEPVPSSSHPSAWVISPHGATGPGSSRSRRPITATATPMKGVIQSTSPNGPAAATPATASAAARTIRATPSTPEEERGVGPEAPVGRERAAGEVGGHEPHEPEHEGRHEHGVAVEAVEQGVVEEHREERDEPEAEERPDLHRSTDHRARSDPPRPPVGHGG